jgi:hypothetical protein
MRYTKQTKPIDRVEHEPRHSYQSWCELWSPFLFGLIDRTGEPRDTERMCRVLLRNHIEILSVVIGGGVGESLTMKASARTRLKLKQAAT